MSLEGSPPETLGFKLGTQNMLTFSIITMFSFDVVPQILPVYPEYPPIWPLLYLLLPPCMYGYIKEDIGILSQQKKLNARMK